MAYWRHMSSDILVNTVSGNGLLPNGTKSLPEPKLTYNQWKFWGIHQTTILQEAHKIWFHKMDLKITFFKLKAHLPGPMSKSNTFTVTCRVAVVFVLEVNPDWLP